MGIFLSNITKTSNKMLFSNILEVLDQPSLYPQEDRVGPKPKNGKENHGKTL